MQFFSRAKAVHHCVMPSEQIGLHFPRKSTLDQQQAIVLVGKVSQHTFFYRFALAYKNLLRAWLKGKWYEHKTSKGLVLISHFATQNLFLSISHSNGDSAVCDAGAWLR